MAMKTLARNLVAECHMEEESTVGTAPLTTGTFDFVGAVQIDLSVSQQQATLQEVALPGASSMMNHSAEYSGTIRVPLQLGNHDQLLAASFRNSSIPTEVSIATSADFDVQSSQTHQDGTTGSRLKGDGTGYFNSLKAAGVFSDLSETVLYLSGFATGDWNYSTRGPVLIKAGGPYEATDTFLDVDQRCELGTTYFGSLTGAIDGSGTVDAGGYIRPRLTVDSNTGSYSLVFRTQGLSSNQYFYLAGVHFGGPTFNINGRGYVEVSIPFVAVTYSDLTTTDPISGGGSRADNTVFKDAMEMSTGLTQAWIMDDTDALDLTGGGVVFSTISFESTPTLVQDSMGNDVPDGVDFPPWTSNLAFQYQVRDETLAADIQALANADDATCSAFFEWTDPAGDWISLYYPQLSVGKSVTSGIGVGGGPITGEFAAQGHLKHRSGSLGTLHRFS